MLPDRSKRYAGIDGDIPRLGLASSWQLFFIALLVIALLYLIFPRKELVEQLYAHKTLDSLTVSYIQNLYRTDPHNADIAILLARTQQDRMDLETLELQLLGLSSQGDLRQRSEAQFILVNAYTRALSSGLTAQKRDLLKVRVKALLETASTDPMTEPVARNFANLAFELGLSQQGFDYLAKVTDGRSANALERMAREALAEGKYSIAAEYYFMARALAPDLSEARRLFFAGIESLMADSLFRQAMQAANQHMGTLVDDPVSLRRMAGIALAAGAPAQAAVYARALVFEASLPRTP